MEEFIKKLYSFDQGKITLCNLIDCIDLEILSSGDVCGLLSETFEKYKLLDPEDQTDISWDDLSSLMGSIRVLIFDNVKLKVKTKSTAYPNDIIRKIKWLKLLQIKGMN